MVIDCRSACKMLVAVCSFSLFASAFCQEQGTEQFLAEMELARTASARDERVLHYKQALALRPNHPDNVKIEFRIGIQLSQYANSANNEKTRPLDALKYFDSVLDNYKIMDYYDGNQAFWGAFSDAPQHMIVQAAIQAGCIHQYETKSPETARKYQHRALKLLNEICEHRRNDWLNGAKPTMPSFEGYPSPTADILADIQGVLQNQQRKWRENKVRAKNGELLFRKELKDAKIAVKYYGLSFGKQRPEEVPLAMNKIIEDFPNTPMAKFAQEHIDRSKEITLGKLTQDVKSITLEKKPPQVAVVAKKEAPAPTPPPAATPAVAVKKATAPPPPKSNKPLLIALGVGAALLLLAALIATRKRFSAKP